MEPVGPTVGQSLDPEPVPGGGAARARARPARNAFAANHRFSCSVGTDPLFTNGWAFVGAWKDADSLFDFNCSNTLPVDGGSQSVTVTGSVAYVTPP